MGEGRRARARPQEGGGAGATETGTWKLAGWLAGGRAVAWVRAVRACPLVWFGLALAGFAGGGMLCRG